MHAHAHTHTHAWHVQGGSAWIRGLMGNDGVVIKFDGFIIMNMGALIGWLGRPWDPTLACFTVASCLV